MLVLLCHLGELLQPRNDIHKDPDSNIDLDWLGLTIFCIILYDSMPDDAFQNRQYIFLRILDQQNAMIIKQQKGYDRLGIIYGRKLHDLNTLAAK